MYLFFFVSFSFLTRGSLDFSISDSSNSLRISPLQLAQLMLYLKEKSRIDMYMHSIQRLRALHLGLGNYVEAAAVLALAPCRCSLIHAVMKREEGTHGKVPLRLYRVLGCALLQHAVVCSGALTVSAQCRSDGRTGIGSQRLGGMH